jgi:hypothetical protein
MKMNERPILDDQLPDSVKAFVARLKDLLGDRIDCFGDDKEIDIFIRGSGKGAAVVIRMGSRGGWHIQVASIGIPVIGAIREHFPEYELG